MIIMSFLKKIEKKNAQKQMKNTFEKILIYIQPYLQWQSQSLINQSIMSFKTILLVSFLICQLCLGQQPSQQPVIGIYTQDAEDFMQLTQKNGWSTYIASSYVKNLQMAGAQVIPLFYHYSYQQLESILGKINGVFFPGGEMPIHWSTDWTNKTAYIFEYAKKQNKLGNVYPLWATCLGYEAIMYITSGQTDNTTVFTEVFGQDGLTCPLIVKNHDSKLLRSLNNPQYTDAISNTGIFFFHHRWSVLEKTFVSNLNWTSFWTLISTSKTANGAEFLSTLQAKQFPFYLTQYHPEKNSYEWRVPAKRTYNAISAQQKFINIFVNDARKNKNVFPEAQLSKKVIYNYQPTLTPLDYPFVQVYVFDESKQINA